MPLEQGSSRCASEIVRGHLWVGGLLSHLSVDWAPDLFVFCAGELSPAGIVADRVVWLKLDDSRPITVAELEAADAAAAQVAECVLAGQRAMCACVEGWNRSALVAGLAMRRLGIPGDRAVMYLRTRRSLRTLGNAEYEAIVRGGIERRGTMFIRRVKTNVKGLADRGALELTPCTLLVGPNGSGKSGVLDAISLALCGSARSAGVEGSQRLLTLAPTVDGRGEVEAAIELSDGSTCQFSVRGQTKGDVPPDWTSTAEGRRLPMGVLVDRVAEGLLFGGEDKLRLAILQATGLPIEVMRVASALAEADRPALRAALGAVLPEQTHIDAPQLLMALERKADELRALHARLEVMQATIAAAPAALTDAEAAELVGLRETFEAVGGLQDCESQLEAARGLRTRAAQLLAEADALDPSDEARAQLEEDRRFQRFFTAIPDMLDLIDATVHEHHLPDVPVCPICTRARVPLGDLARARSTAQTALKDCDTRIAPVAEAMAAAATKRANAAGMVGRADRIEGHAKAGLSTAQAARQRMLELEAQRTGAEAAAAERAQVPALAEEAQTTAQIVKTLRDAVGVEVTRQAAVIEKRMNVLLPKSMRARIVTEEDGAPVCRVDVSIDESRPRDFCALSRTQQALLLSSFAASTIPGGAAPVRLLTVDERWLDAKTTRTLLKLIATAVTTPGSALTQAIVCVVQYSGKTAPPGWSMIQLTPPTRTDADPGDGSRSGTGPATLFTDSADEAAVDALEAADEDKEPIDV